MNMTPERWHCLEEAFARARDVPAGKRAAVVRALAGDDHALAAEVLSLLDAAEESPNYLDRLAARLPFADADTPQVSDSSGRLVGPYRLTRLLGHGGMGSVYLAERIDGTFEQTVAVKLLPLGGMRPALERRFRAERQILAWMRHPNIARLLDGGVTPDGTPYFVMEHVDGVALDAYCERHALSTERRLRLFLDVCGAVEAAHSNLVIHRDLKPANVLVTAAGTVKLLDFGIAKLLEDDAGMTEPQPLSPAYASPEQLQGGPLTTAVDVWGLGVILYELLAGRRPFEGRRLGDHAPPPPPGQFRRNLARDLDTIVMKALQTEPERRYPSVVHLADDIRRHLEGLPIRARAESWTYRLGCFARRHRYGVAAATAIVLLLAALTALSLHSAVRAREQAARIAQERDASQQVTKFLVEVFAAADPAAERGQTVTARELLDRGAARVRTELAGRPQIQATMLGTIGRVYRQLGLLDQAAPLLEQALAQRQRLFAAPHPAIAEALHELGLARWSAGRAGEAEKLVRQALDMRQALSGGAHEEALASRIALGRLLTETGRPADAAQTLRHAVQHARALGEDAAPLQAQSLYYLAMALHHQGKLAEVDASARQAAALYRRLPMAPTPESVESLLMLAGLERIARRPAAQVQALFAEALVAHRRLYGADHPKYAAALNGAAMAAAQAGDYAQAEAQLKQAIRIYSRQPKLEKDGLSIAFTNLGDLRRSRGDLDGAEWALVKALETGRGMAKPTAHALYGLAQIHQDRGQLARASQRLDEAAQKFREAFGPDNPMLPRLNLARGELAHARGDHQGAQALFGEALQGYEALLGPKHALVARARLGLGTCLRETGRESEARPLLAAAEAVLRTKAGADAADTQRAAVALRAHK